MEIAVKKVGLRIFPALVILLAVATTGAIISYFRLFDRYELATLDIRSRIKPNAPVADKIVFIDIDDNTKKRLGTTPFDRGNDAVFVKAITEFGAKAVFFDMSLDVPTAGDAELEAAMQESGNVYLPTLFYLRPEGGDIPRSDLMIQKCPSQFIAVARGVGHVNVTADVDGKCRRIFPYIQYRNNFYPEIAVLIACDYLGIKQRNIDLMPGEFLQCGRLFKIPLDESSSMLIPYTGRGSAGCKRYSYIDVVQSYFKKASGKESGLDPTAFRGKICIVGLPDKKGSSYIYPEILGAILSRSFTMRASRMVNLAVVIAAVITIGVMTLILGPVKGLAALIVIIMLYVIGLVRIFSASGLWIDMVCPVVVMLSVYFSIMPLRVR